MNHGLMRMGLLGWVLAFVLGFLVGGVFFLSIKAQVQYVLTRRGPLWLVPALLYARMVFVGVVLVVTALFIPRDKVAPALLAALAGTIVARVLVARMVKRGSAQSAAPREEE